MLGIFADTATIEVLQRHDVIQLLAVNTVRIVDVTIGVAHGQNLTPQLENFLGRVLRHITRTADEDSLTLDVHTTRLQHLLEEINIAITRSLGTDKGATELTALAGENTAEFARQLLVHTEHEAHFTSAHADVTGGNIDIRTDVAP